MFERIGAPGGFTPPDPATLQRKARIDLADFSALLDTLSSLETKRKSLWKQIYENAVQDRILATVLFGDLYLQMAKDSDTHILNGPIIAKYMERLEKSNAQLIKLAELVEKASEDASSEILDESEIYSQLENVRITGG
jgi:hypothetical protein